MKRLPHARERVLDAYRQRGPRSERGRKERNRKKVDPTGLIKLALLAVLVAQSLRVAFASPRLHLQQVEIAGTSRLAPEDVIRLARVPIGQNIFAVNLVRVSEALHAVPVIREASVTRDLPHSLHVEIQERVPALQVVTEHGNFHADRDGVVFEAAAALKPDMPTLELPAKDLPKLGQPIKAEWVQTVWACAELAKKQHVNVHTMRVDGAGELWLNVATPPTGPDQKGGLLVRIGRSTDLPEKFQDIRNSLAGRPTLASTAAYLDVMCAGSPAYMPAADTPDTAKQ
ncbi:MAG TPA: FtsQ-type POTRA domain-containing protein, partial [Armatimonadota bacterium]|nr:FtsQ-type POTRA domain-containing protein [Armatimonadota bacterium]